MSGVLVLYVDPNAEHRALAERYGARTAAEIEPIHQGFDIAVEATGRVEELAIAVQSLKPEGICESAGNHFAPGELPLLAMYLNSMTLRIGRDNVRTHMPEALDLAVTGDVHPEWVVSNVFDWEELPDQLPGRHSKPVFVRDPNGSRVNQWHDGHHTATHPRCGPSDAASDTDEDPHDPPS